MTHPVSPPLPVLPVIIEARHVRLSAAHVELLFGAGHALVPLAPLPHTGRFACAEVVAVRGPGGALGNVRVLGPVAPATRVVLGDSDLEGLQLEAGCTIDGPRSTLVVGKDAIRRLRRAPRGAAEAARRALVDGAHVDVQVRAERARELRGLPLEVDAELADSGYVAVEIGDANGLDVSAATRATLSSRE